MKLSTGVCVCCDVLISSALKSFSKDGWSMQNRPARSSKTVEILACRDLSQALLVELPAMPSSLVSN